MAVTTTYAFQDFKPLLLASAGGSSPDMLDTDMTSLANGGIAVAGVHSGHVDFNLYDGPKLPNSAYNVMVTGVETAIGQLVDGNVVIASASGGVVYYSLADANGAFVPGAQSVSLGASTTSAPDVAALAGGGFVVVGHKQYAGVDRDIQVFIRNADGSEAVSAFTPDISGANDTKASVCALNDGGFAVAWERDVAGDTEIVCAVYEANGSVRTSASVVDTNGSINRGVSAVALPDGGFALVYEDNQWALNEREITFNKFSYLGGVVDQLRVTPELGGFTAGGQAYATLLSNGLVAVSYTRFSDNDADKELMVQLVNPNSLNAALLTTAVLVSDGGTYSNQDSSAAGVGLAGLAVGWEKESASDGASMKLVRTSTGDAAADTITGDDAIDVISGAAGTDLLRGFANNDTIDGGADNDTLLGGEGFDILTGGAGGDILSGNQGKDNFRYLSLSDSQAAAPDQIFGLAGKDRIVLADIDANANKAGDQRFQLVAEFDGHAGQAVLTYHATGIYAGDTTLELDVNGDFVADALIRIDGDHDDFTRFVL